MDAVLGSWIQKKETSQNVDAFVAAAGIPDAMKETFKNRIYQMTCARDGDNFHWTAKVTNDPNLNTEELNFQLDKEFTFVDVDKQNAKGLIKWDGSQFVEKYWDARGVCFECCRKVEGDLMNCVMTINGVTMTESWEKC